MTLVAMTGGTGFLGSATRSVLASSGACRVRLLTRSIRPDAMPNDVVVGDIDDPEACDRLVDGADVVVHLAGLVRSRDTEALERANVRGTLALLRASHRAGARRFVHVSTTGVYGRPGCGVNEFSPRRPANPYERSKATAEEAVLSGWGPEVVVIQPSNIVGVGAPNRPLRRFFARVRSGRSVVHAGAWTNYVDVAAVARVVAATATETDVPRVLIVNTPMPLDAFTALVGEAVGRSGRSVHLPDAIGQALIPVVSATARLVPTFERSLALIDATHFVTRHQDWIDAHRLDLGVDRAVREMAVEFGIVGQ